MKRFLSKVVLFSSILIGLITICLYATKRLINNKATFTVKPGIQHIILGHSHTACAYNDSLIANLANFGESAESYFYSYYKALKLIEHNKNISTVFIEFSNNSIETHMDEWIWNNYTIKYRYPVYSPFMHPEDKQLLLANNPMAVIGSLGATIKKGIGAVIKSNYDYTGRLGGYYYLVKDKTDSLLKSKNFDTQKLTNKLSQNNLVYLRNIIDLCKSKKVKVYLIRSPLHAKYSTENEEMFKKLLTTKYKDVEFLDFKNFPLLNSEFGDLQHLNYRGARKFSLFFDELLKKGLLQVNEKQLFIEENFPII